VDDAHREPAVLVIANPFDTCIAQPHALPSDPLEPEVRVGGAEILSPLQSRVGKRSGRQSEESRVDLVGHLQPPALAVYGDRTAPILSRGRRPLLIAVERLAEQTAGIGLSERGRFAGPTGSG
jgi:hypothetical protein